MNHEDDNNMRRPAMNSQEKGEFTSAYDDKTYYYIETGVDASECSINGNKFRGSAEIIYYETEDDYETDDASYISSFEFEWNMSSDKIKIYNCNYEDDIDIEDLLDNLKENILPELQEEQYGMFIYQFN